MDEDENISRILDMGFSDIKVGANWIILVASLNLWNQNL